MREDLAILVTRKGLGIALLCAFLALGTAPEHKHARSGALSGASMTRRCPHALAPRAFAPEALVAAVRRTVPDAYRTMTNQHGRVRLTPRNYRVLETIFLGQTLPEVPGRVAYLRIASRQCGLQVAEHSWVVFLDFPEAGSILGVRGISFFARTSVGWRLWYRYR